MQVIDLGYQPLADDLVKVSEFNRECIYYPIKINFMQKMSIFTKQLHCWR